MYRPQKVKTYDPTNPEYGLVDMMVSEAFEAVSPEIYYWSLDTVTTKTSMDALDKVYGEKSSTSKITYKEPKLVHARIDFNPILKELSKLGTTTKEEVEIFVNIASVMEELDNNAPKSGDILRVSYINHDPYSADNKSVTFYTVSQVTPVDLYNNRYTNLQISAEQTTMNEVPDKIKKFIY